MLAQLIHNIYFKKSCFYAVIGIDFLFVLVFAFVYADLLPWLQGGPALRFNIVRERAIFDGPVTDYLHCFYFSVVTQMTVGFGDIIPVSEPARLVVSLQAAFGYFYLAVLVSVLVGRVFSSKRILVLLGLSALQQLTSGGGIGPREKRCQSRTAFSFSQSWDRSGIFAGSGWRRDGGVSETCRKSWRGECACRTSAFRQRARTGESRARLGECAVDRRKRPPG